jgi:excisionase family DNA binding protein
MNIKEHEAKMSELLTIKETMSELKVCRATLYKHLKSGSLISYRVGRLVRITRGDLLDFIKQNRSNCRRPTRRQN